MAASEGVPLAFTLEENWLHFRPVVPPEKKKRGDFKYASRASPWHGSTDPTERGWGASPEFARCPDTLLAAPFLAISSDFSLQHCQKYHGKWETSAVRVLPVVEEQLPRRPGPTGRAFYPSHHFGGGTQSKRDRYRCPAYPRGLPGALVFKHLLHFQLSL